ASGNVDVCEATVRGVEHGTRHRVGFLLRSHDGGAGDELLGRRHDEYDGDDRNVMRTDANDLRVVDIDALGRRFELPERVHGRGRDKTMTRGCGDRALRKTDCLVVFTDERDAYQRTQPVRLGRDGHD